MYERITFKEWLQFAAVIVCGIMIAAIVSGLTVTFTAIHPVIALVLGYIVAGLALLTLMGDWTDAGTDAARHASTRSAEHA